MKIFLTLKCLQCLSDCCILSLTLPFNITFPNTDASLSRVLQFQRWNWNWLWHSLMPILAPSPRLTITPGCIRQRRRWRPASPGMLSHNTPAPTAWSGNWLINLKRQQQSGINILIHYKDKAYIQSQLIDKLTRINQKSLHALASSIIIAIGW